MTSLVKLDFFQLQAKLFFQIDPTHSTWGSLVNEFPVQIRIFHTNPSRRKFSELDHLHNNEAGGFMNMTFLCNSTHVINSKQIVFAN